MVILNWFAERKERILEPRFRRRDLVLSAVFLLCLGLLILAWTQGVFSARGSYPVSQGYQARMKDGYVYVLDSGHSTLTKATPEGKIVYRVSPGLYIDGFTLGEDGSVYLNASLFNGMTVVGERVLRYDAGGGGPQVLAEQDCAQGYLARHALHGAGERGGILRYAECREDGILSHAVNLGDLSGTETFIPYPAAFDAVSDAMYEGDILYVLDRNGTVTRFTADGAGEVVYNVDAAGEGARVPYRLAVSDTGAVYFTDIRSRTVQRILMNEGRSVTAAEDTDSVTADVLGPEGGETCILTAEGTVWLPGGTLTAFRSSPWPVVLLCLTLILLVYTALQALFLLARLINVLRHWKSSSLQRLMLAVLAVGAATAVFTGAILISSFRKAYTDKINEELILSSLATANGIRPEDVGAIQAARDYGGEAYRRLSLTMERCFDRSVDFNLNAYCNILRWDGEGCAYAIAYLDGSIGTYYPLGDYETAETVTVYETKKPVISKAFEDISGIYLGVKVPILDENGNCVGVVSSGTQVVLLEKLLRSMILRVLTGILFFGIIIWFLFSEVFAYVKNRELYRIRTESAAKFPGHTFRVVLVLVFAVYNLQAAFLPGYIVRQLPMDSKNAEVLGSLPYMVNIFLFGITAILCARALRHVGPGKLMILSVAASFAGNLLIFLAPGYVSILLGMALIGVGVGLLSNMMNILLTYVNDDEDRIWGLSISNAAAMAGINIGMVGGSVLAVLLGQRAVFAITAGLWVLLLFLSLRLLKLMSGALTIHREEPVAKGQGGLRALFRGKLVPYFMICIQNPYILFSAFVMYYLPIFCETRGYSETSTALMLLCYTELSVLVGEAMVAWSRRRMKDGAMYAAIGLAIAALIVFALTQDLLGMILALFLLGVSASFGKPVQQLYYIRLPQVKGFGQDRAMGIYNFTENIGESLGPVAMGWIMFRTPMFPYVAGFCAMVAMLGGGFALYARGRKKSEKEA